MSNGWSLWGYPYCNRNSIASVVAVSIQRIDAFEYIDILVDLENFNFVIFFQSPYFSPSD